MATLLLGDLDVRAGDHAAAATRFAGIMCALLMDEYRDRGRRPASLDPAAPVDGDGWAVAQRRRSPRRVCLR